LQELIMELNYPVLQAVVQSGPTPLFATISGAHLYGFPSPDSDIDLRGAFVLPLDAVLRLRDPEETITLTQVHDGVEVDWVAHDICKFARLMLKRNGYVLEQLFSPLVVLGGEWLDELRVIGRGCIIRHLYHHYRGFAHTQFDLLARPTATVKELLYAYRVLLTGIFVLETGEIEANLVILNARYRQPGVDELIARKSSGVEHGTLAPTDLTTHQPQLDRLMARLEQAFQDSHLPDEPTTYTALDDFVVRARLKLGQHG
jgi:predicted nucleotidyltransferase